MKHFFWMTRGVLLLLALCLLLGGCAHRPAAPAPETGPPDAVSEAAAASPAESTARPNAETHSSPEVPAESTAYTEVETIPTTEVPTESIAYTEEATASTTETPTENTADTEEATLPTAEAPAEEPFVYMGLVEMISVDERFVIDQRYATENNFTGRIHYDRELCLVQEDILPMLIRAADLAEAEGCRIKIWDAYRPISVQQALHDSAPAELAPYVPAPGPWSMHARGITVDVTLCDMEGNELDMPTEFDDFSVRANSDNTDATAEQIANRELLNRIMSGAGFTRSKLEWWHFDGPNRDNYQVLDLSFADYEAARDGS